METSTAPPNVHSASPPIQKMPDLQISNDTSSQSNFHSTSSDSPPVQKKPDSFDTTVPASPSCSDTLLTLCATPTARSIPATKPASTSTKQPVYFSPSLPGGSLSSLGNHHMLSTHNHCSCKKDIQSLYNLIDQLRQHNDILLN